MSQLECDSKVYGASPQGQILEIIFRGTHEWTHGREMLRYVEKMLAECPATGFIINLLDYEYVGGHLGAPLIAVAYDRDTKRVCPVCVVMTGATYTSLYRYLKITKLIDVLRVEFASTVESALQRLRERLGEQV